MSKTNLQPPLNDESSRDSIVVEVGMGRAPHLGSFSYWVPSSVAGGRGADELKGRLIKAPFGKSEDWGVIIGEGDPSLATRELTHMGARVLTPELLEVVSWTAERWCATTTRALVAAVPREVMRSLGNDGTVDDATDISPTDAGGAETSGGWARRYVAVAPRLDLAEVAWETAHTAATDGVVLVLAPSRSMVRSVVRAVENHQGENAERVEVVVLSGSEPESYRRALGVGEGASRKGLVLVGTRHHALWPVGGLSAIVVVDDNHPGHRAPTEPHANSRDVAIARSRTEEVTATIVGRVPGPEALWGGVRFTEAGSKSADWPQMTVLFRERGETGLPHRAVTRVKKCLKEGGRVAVVHPKGRAGWHCVKCRRAWMCQRCDTQVMVGGCECGPNPDAARCGRCSAKERMILGWDERRVAREVGGVRAVNLPAGVTALTPADLYAAGEGNFDLVVVTGADTYSGWRSDPGLEATRVVLHAAALVGPAGELWCVGAKRNGVSQALTRTRSVRGIAKRGWEMAKEAGLAPFVREVEISVTGPKPDVSGLPGRVHGPTKGTDGWVLVVRCADRELGEVVGWITEMREGWRRRLRVDVR